MSDDLMLPDAETLVRIEKGVDEFMAKWKQVEKERSETLWKRRLARLKKKAESPSCRWAVEYESGFRWVFDKRRLRLVAPNGAVAADVSLIRGPMGFPWHVWDEDGVGGENASEKTVDLAKMAAESALLRWGQHFRPLSGKPESQEVDQ